MDSIDSHPSMLLGPWEQSITGVKPTEQLITQVADFLFMHVVSRNDLGELSSRGVEIEIEAKLGQLISSDTNERLNLPVTTECIIAEGQRMVGFRSAMTEVINS
jgi:polynucleotide 5'-triphosphatase